MSTDRPRGIWESCWQCDPCMKEVHITSDHRGCAQYRWHSNKRSSALLPKLGLALAQQEPDPWQSQNTSRKCTPWEENGSFPKWTKHKQRKETTLQTISSILPYYFHPPLEHSALHNRYVLQPANKNDLFYMQVYHTYSGVCQKEPGVCY